MDNLRILGTEPSSAILTAKRSIIIPQKCQKQAEARRGGVPSQFSVTRNSFNWNNNTSFVITIECVRAGEYRSWVIYDEVSEVLHLNVGEMSIWRDLHHILFLMQYINGTDASLPLSLLTKAKCTHKSKWETKYQSFSGENDLDVHVLRLFSMSCEYVFVCCFIVSWWCLVFCLAYFLCWYVRGLDTIAYFVVVAHSV